MSQDSRQTLSNLPNYIKRSLLKYGSKDHVVNPNVRNNSFNNQLQLSPNIPSFVRNLSNDDFFITDLNSSQVLKTNTQGFVDFYGQKIVRQQLKESKLKWNYSYIVEIKKKLHMKCGLPWYVWMKQTVNDKWLTLLYDVSKSNFENVMEERCKNSAEIQKLILLNFGELVDYVPFEYRFKKAQQFSTPQNNKHSDIEMKQMDNNTNNNNMNNNNNNNNLNQLQLQQNQNKKHERRSSEEELLRMKLIDIHQYRREHERKLRLRGVIDSNDQPTTFFSNLSQFGDHYSDRSSSVQYGVSNQTIHPNQQRQSNQNN